MTTLKNSIKCPICHKQHEVGIEMLYFDNEYCVSAYCELMQEVYQITSTGNPRLLKIKLVPSERDLSRLIKHMNRESEYEYSREN